MPNPSALRDDTIAALVRHGAPWPEGGAVSRRTGPFQPTAEDISCPLCGQSHPGIRTHALGLRLLTWPHDGEWFMASASRHDVITRLDPVSDNPADNAITVGTAIAAIVLDILGDLAQREGFNAELTAHWPAPNGGNWTTYLRENALDPLPPGTPRTDADPLDTEVAALIRQQLDIVLPREIDATLSAQLAPCHLDDESHAGVGVTVNSHVTVLYRCHQRWWARVLPDHSPPAAPFADLQRAAILPVLEQVGDLRFVAAMLGAWITAVSFQQSAPRGGPAAPSV